MTSFVTPLFAAFLPNLCLFWPAGQDKAIFASRDNVEPAVDYS